jgi:hypothetical protein
MKVLAMADNRPLDRADAIALLARGVEERRFTYRRTFGSSPSLPAVRGLRTPSVPSPP